MPGLKPKLRSGIYYAIGSVAGQRVRTSLGTRHRGQAEELCAQYEAKLWKRHSYGEEAVRTFEEAALSYMNADGEATFLPPLIARFRGRVLGSIKPEEIRQAARSLYPGRKPATWNRNALVPARAVINHAADLGWCPKISVTAFEVERVRRFAADRVWLNAFLAQADKDGLPHLAAVVMFMWQTAARVSEAARVLPEHVNLTDRVILLEDTKEGKWEPCHITRELMLRLANLTMTEGEPVFGYASRYGIYARMKAVCRRAKLAWRPPHQAGRHSFATNALAMGATPKQVMEGGRWKSERMVMEIYAHADAAGREIADLFDTDRAQSKATRPRKQASSRRNRK